MNMNNWCTTMETKARLSDFSSLSVVYAVDRFIKSVEAMNETIMVPSRLLNVEAPKNDKELPQLLRGGVSDPYAFFALLNKVKMSLVWGFTDQEETLQDVEKALLSETSSSWYSGPHKTPSENSSRASKEKKGHMRRISSVSTGSVASGLSEHESERLSDSCDSGLESEDVEQNVEITSVLKGHLVGLQNCLRQLTETANYITKRYQEEVSA